MKLLFLWTSVAHSDSLTSLTQLRRQRRSRLVGGPGDGETGLGLIGKMVLGPGRTFPTQK